MFPPETTQGAGMCAFTIRSLNRAHIYAKGLLLPEWDEMQWRFARWISHMPAHMPRCTHNAHTSGTLPYFEEIQWSTVYEQWEPIRILQFLVHLFSEKKVTDGVLVMKSILSASGLPWPSITL